MKYRKLFLQQFNEHETVVISMKFGRAPFSISSLKFELFGNSIVYCLFNIGEKSLINGFETLRKNQYF